MNFGIFRGSSERPTGMRILGKLTPHPTPQTHNFFSGGRAQMKKPSSKKRTKKKKTTKKRTLKKKIKKSERVSSRIVITGFFEVDHSNSTSGDGFDRFCSVLFLFLFYFYFYFIFLLKKKKNIK